MEEIEIGEYVRLEDGRIYEFISYAKRRKESNREFVKAIKVKSKGKVVLVNSIKIKNHNKNIIELVKVGDYVNGYKVVEIDEYKPIGDVLQKYLKVDCSRLLNAIYSEQIKTILTKEQYEANCFRLEV